MDDRGARLEAGRPVKWLLWDEYGLLIGNDRGVGPFPASNWKCAEGQKWECYQFATLRNLVHSTAFVFVWVGLFTSLEKWCRNVPLASVTCAVGFGLCQTLLSGRNCSSQWPLCFEVGGRNSVGSQDHAQVSGGMGQEAFVFAPSKARAQRLLLLWATSWSPCLPVSWRVPGVRTCIGRPRNSNFRKILSLKTPPGLSLFTNLLYRCVFPSSEILHSGLGEIPVLCSGLALGTRTVGCSDFVLSTLPFLPFQTPTMDLLEIMEQKRMFAQHITISVLVEQREIR